MTKYKLKPGKHQFAPGSYAVHDNDSLTDEDAAWYLERYPHIKPLFEEIPGTQAPVTIISKPKRPRRSYPAALIHNSLNQ